MRREWMAPRFGAFEENLIVSVKTLLKIELMIVELTKQPQRKSYVKSKITLKS